MTREKTLYKAAEKIIKLHKNMDDTFGDSHSGEHLKLAIMAGLMDAEKIGYVKGRDSVKHFA